MMSPKFHLYNVYLCVCVLSRICLFIHAFQTGVSGSERNSSVLAGPLAASSATQLPLVPAIFQPFLVILQAIHFLKIFICIFYFTTQEL